MVAEPVGQLETLSRHLLKFLVKSTTYNNPTFCRVFTIGACLLLQSGA